MGLSLRPLGRRITDIFDANTEADQQKRLAAGQARWYQDTAAQQKPSVLQSLKNTALATAKWPVTAPVELTRAGVGKITGNQAAASSAMNRLDRNFDQSLYGLVGNPAGNAFRAGIVEYPAAYYGATRDAYGTGQRGDFWDKFSTIDARAKQQLINAGRTGDITRDLAAPGIDTGLNLLSLGTTSLAAKPLLAKARQQGLSAAAKYGGKTLAEVGAQNFAQGVGQELYNENPNFKRAIKSGLTNAAVGTATDLATVGLGYGLNKGGKKIVQKAPAASKAVVRAIDKSLDTPAAAELRTTRARLQKQWDTASPQTRKQIEKAIRSVDDEIKRAGQGGFIQLTRDAKPKVAVKGAPSKIDPTDPFGNRSLLRRIRNEAGSLVDDDAQMITLLKKIEKQTGRKGLVDQWYFDSGNIRASNSIANSKLRQSEDLKQAFRGLSKRGMNDYDKYAAARAELKNYDGLATSKTGQELADIVAQGNPKYAARFEAQNSYYKKLAQDMYEGGLITKEKLDEYLSNDDYIRIQRDMEDLVSPGFGNSKSRSIGSTKATQRRSGSKREILSPSSTTATRAQQIELEIQRNRAANNTLDVLEEAGLARRVDDSKNKNTVSRLRDGKKETFEVPADIKRVMENVSPYQLGTIAKIVSAPVRVLKAGATGLSAPFTVVNYLRDQSSSALYSKNVLATHNPLNVAQGLGSAARDFAGDAQHPLWKKYEMYLGDQTKFDDLRNVQNNKRLLRELRRGKAGKYGNMATSPIRTLEDLNSITEKATRFQNFKGAYDKVFKKTGDDAAATKAAVLAARQNSTDFSRSSSFTRVMNLFIPYFNPAVQGSRTTARAFKERPVSTSMKSIGLVVVPSVAATAYNMADEERRKVYESISDYEKEDNFIIVGPSPKQRADGSWEGVYKIPKPQGYRELTDPARDITEAFLKGESVEDTAGMFKDMLGGLTGPINIESPQKLVGGLIPQQVKPFVQYDQNKDYYTGSKTVPDFMNNAVDAEGKPIDESLKAYKNSSGTARLIGNALDASPIKVEKFITDASGSVGRYGINAADNILASQGKIPQNQIGGRSIKSDFSRRLFEARGDLLEENKTPGQKYYENLKAVTDTLNPNEQAAFNALHPQKKNFLGEQVYKADTTYDPAARLDIYNRFPKVFEADKALDRKNRDEGKPGNPMFDLKKWQLKKVLEKENLPPGAKDPELSNLYDQEWYVEYKNKKTEFFTKLKTAAAKENRPFGKQDNPYPETPPEVQAAMDYYNTLPKGTGARSAWIRSNPGVWSAMKVQYAKVDNWQNVERGQRGLDFTEGLIGDIAGYGDSSGSSGYGSYGSGGGSGSGSKGVGSAYKYAVSLNAGGEIAKPKISVKQAGAAPSRKASRRPAPKVSLKRSLV